MYGRNLYNKSKSLIAKEKNWNQRFVLDKIPKFNAYNDVNYISLGLLKSKIRYEERIKREEANSKYAGRIYSAHYKPKSSARMKKGNIFNQKSLSIINRNRDLSMRISLNQKAKNKTSNTLNHYLYQGTLTAQNFAGSYIFNYTPDYKNKDINKNLRKIICQDDPEVAEEYDLVNDLWEKLGVTESYVDNFNFILNTKSNNREAILQMLNGEKKQMRKFRVELMKVISEIAKRDNKIKDLKQFINAYSQVKEMNKKNKMKQDNENEGELRTKNVGEVNKELIENDIHECLKSLRLRTINTVNLIRKFNSSYSSLFNSKINLKYIRNKYGFDDKYLLKIKNDLDFLKDSEINTLYHFSEKGGDPFLLYISDKCADPTDFEKFKILPISNDILAIIRTYMFSLEEEDIFLKIKNQKFQYQSPNQFFKSNNIPEDNITGNNINNDLNNTNNNMVINSYNTKKNNTNNNITNNNLNNISNNNEKDVKKIISNINNANSPNAEEKYDDLHLNLNKKVTLKVDELYQIPGMTSKQMERHLKKYGKLKREIFPPFNRDAIKEEVQKNIIQKIEDRMNIVEKEFNAKMNENLKKEQKKLKDEEMALKEEQEHIEKLKIEEEEERQRKEEKYQQLEKEINKRKKNDKKKREENERLEKKENDIFLKEIQMKIMKEVDDRFKNENDVQFESKKAVIDDLEKKDKEKVDQMLKLKYAEYKELIDAGIPIDLRSEKSKNKSDSHDSSERHKKRNKRRRDEDESDNKSSRDDKTSKKKETEDNEESESKSKTKSRKTKSKRRSASSDNEEEEEENDEKEESSSSN